MLYHKTSRKVLIIYRIKLENKFIDYANLAMPFDVNFYLSEMMIRSLSFHNGETVTLHMYFYFLREKRKLSVSYSRN